jgi:uncharacterized protein YecE (DUF72 family)
MAPEIRLGTSGFTADGWPGSFYPEGMKPPDYLPYYSTRFDTVEINSTFYQLPTVETVTNWALKSPPGFVFSLGVPRVITHDKILLDCREEIERFINAANILGQKLGPILLQFPHFNSSVFSSSAQFISRLDEFLNKLPRGGCKFAIEIRNKHWLTPWFADQLRGYNVALVLQDQSWMPRLEVLSEKFDPITADFAFVRWQGDHKGIQQRTKVWNRTIFDRTAELRTWVDFCGKIQKRGIKQFIYAGNHYAGYAPATLELFRSLCHERGIVTPLGSAVLDKPQFTRVEEPTLLCNQVPG